MTSEERLRRRDQLDRIRANGFRSWAESREEHMRLPFAPACILPFVVLASTAQAQSAPQPAGESRSALALFQQMVGTWDVQQRMWPASGAQAINLPPAIARRHLIGDAYLEETMELASESKVSAFTRNAFFNYNAVNQQYEYFSIDTRAPQIMLERDHGPVIRGEPQEFPIVLYGGSFVAPQ